MGPSKLVASMLDLGVVSCLPVHPHKLTDRKQRMGAIHSGRLEMEREIARMRLHTVANTIAHSAVDFVLSIADVALVYKV